MKNIIVIGKSGQLAHELKLLNEQVHCLGRDDIDITDASSMSTTLDSFSAHIIINASAYTAVDQAETDKDKAFLLNQHAVENLAKYCQQKGIFLVHVSTDYVFAGSKGAPYLVNDSIAPQGVYGQSKAAGEQALLRILPDNSTIIRTSWVYSSHGNNFVKTMLRLMAEKPALKVIDDQIGSPSAAYSLAEACIEAGIQQHTGIYHWSDEGVCSWYDFACAIQELGIEKGLLSKAIPITPIPSSDYPTPAIRPTYSVLDKTNTRKQFSTRALHWRVQLSRVLDTLTLHLENTP